MASLDFSMTVKDQGRDIPVRVLAETRRVRTSIEIRRLVVQSYGFSVALADDQEQLVRDEVVRRAK